jgi:protein-S-isoprenylcysteine O-methyltransferase Ste14
MRKTAKALDYSVMTLAILTGVGSVALFAWEQRPVFVPMNWSPGGALAWDTMLSIAFFVQHSGMVRRPVRARVAALVAPRYDGAVYAIASGVALALAFVLWQPTGAPLFALRGVARSVAIACSALAAAVFVFSMYTLRTFDPLGLRPIRAHLRGAPDRPVPFVVRGPYRFVRHPLYSCILVMLWAKPEMTADRLLLAALWSAWIWVGAVLEERDLVAEFGDRYRRYRRQVPMLVPWRGPVTVRDEVAAGAA